MEERINKLNELLENDEIRFEISKTSDPDAVKKILEENGLVMTEEEFDAVMMRINDFYVENNLVDENGELTEEGLELVSGGANYLWGAAMLLKTLGGLSISGTALAVGLGGAVVIGCAAVAICYAKSRRR